MRKILSLIAISFLMISCSEELKFNDPGFQGQKDDVFWRANDTRAYIDNGKLTIEAYTQYEIVTLGTSSTNVGKYRLGTTNTNNFASYTYDVDDIFLEYATVPSPGPASLVTIQNGGTGYSNASSVAVTGGTGSGMSVSIVTNSTGVVTSITLMSRGNGYVAGDLVTVTGGNLNCKLRVQNVQNSNGEIEITSFDDVKMTVSGKFKFNAVKTTNSPFGGEVVNYQYGEFHNVQIYPSI